MDFLQKWLSTFKIQNAISPNDILRDKEILTYLEISFNNISTNYCGKTLPDPNWLTTAQDNSHIKMATIHYATTLFNNPDMQTQGRDVVDDRMIYKILGPLVVYK